MSFSIPPYNYKNSIKSDISDELVNVYIQRPLAGGIVRAVYYTSITPNQLTLISIFFGILGGILVALPDARLIAGALCFYLKDLFDSADGQLARAKQQFSRRGRFLDSIGDLIVDMFLFGGIGVFLYRSGMPMIDSAAISFCGFLCLSLRVSYHVFYQTSFLHSQQQYQTNRITEELREEDYREDMPTFILQKLFLFLYGWQDQWMVRLDRWCLGENFRKRGVPQEWYQNGVALRLSGLLGFGTEYIVLTLCMLLGSVKAYLFFSLIFFNIIWFSAILYRKYLLR